MRIKLVSMNPTVPSLSDENRISQNGRQNKVKSSE